ncbi:ATP-binding protein [Flavobacterium sp. I-SCBP12n]|uniref:ATP-binding protein n=1 Tax=Flavobacterium pygoscelis TaxID=2893176 RepID=A0A9X2BMR4_9FLAO|nr:ATP-binding protein [Flavobacterium pygoscelis]MCK8143332.1 ATP-binding protein [Flavobacterium pygoscelis]
MNSNYIEKIFGKPRNQVKLLDIEEYFSTPQEESSVVEFKSGEVEINDIFKEITAFLNTEGGLLIIGAPRETKKELGKNIIKVCEGNLTYSNFKNKDWLYQKIASNIVPTPTDLKIEEFLTKNGNVFLIDISQSLTPPHQCSSDGKYYLRLERDAKPAPHGIVQALFDKRRVPILSTDITITKINNTDDEVLIRIQNESRIPADKVAFIVDIYNVADVNSSHQFEIQKDILANKFSMSNHTIQVLVQIISIPIKLNIRHFNKDYLIFVGFWCRDLDFDFKYFTYSPSEKKIVTIGTLKDGGLLTDELNRIVK